MRRDNKSTTSPRDGQPVILPRRDLFDVRFQLLNNSDADAENERISKELEFVDAPSDLVPGFYKGGIKT